LVPEQRGQHREKVISELTYILAAHGVRLITREKPGPKAYFSAEQIVYIIQRLRCGRAKKSVREASQMVADDPRCSSTGEILTVESVVRKYWNTQKQMRSLVLDEYVIRFSQFLGSEVPEEAYDQLVEDLGQEWVLTSSETLHCIGNLLRINVPTAAE
jgi:hypothetical protein